MEALQLDHRAIVDALSDAILIQDAESGTILEVNQGMCAMFGYSPAEARRLNLAVLVSSEAGEPEDTAAGWLAAVAAGAAQTLECQARDKAGRVFWVEADLKPFRLGQRDGILAVLRDIDQRKRAAEALKESEARYRLLAEESLSGVYVIQDGRFVYANPTMGQIFGYRPEEIMHRAVTPEAMVHPDDLPLVRETIRRRLAGELEAAHYTFRGLRRDGKVIYCESFGRIVEYQGHPAIVGTLLDITEPQQAAEALRIHTHILRSMAEGVVVTDPDGKIIYTNPAFDATFGYQTEELIGLQVSVLNDFSPSESARFAQAVVDQLQTKGILSGEVRNRKKDGTTFYSRVRISGLDFCGKTGWIMVQEDITERQQVETALRESEASYRIVTEFSLAGVYLIQDGIFRYVNPMLAQAFGYAPVEIIDRLGPLDLVHPEDRERIAANMQQRLAGEGEGTRNHFKGVRRDGSAIYCEVLTRKVDYHGRPAIMGTFLDITERRLAEEALKASEAKYRTIFETVNDAIVVFAPESGEFLEFNQRYLEMIGCRPEDAGFLNLPQVCSADPPYTFQDAQALIEKVAAEGPQLFEWLAEDRHGRRFWVEISLTSSPLGVRHLLLAVIRDISERKQVEEIRTRGYEKLEQLVAERTARLEAANQQLLHEIEVRRRTERIIRLQRDLALALNGSVGLQQTLRFCVETAITISGLDSGALYLVDPASGTVDLAAHQGLSPKFVQNVAHYSGDSLNAYMVMAGKPLYARLQDLPGLLNEENLQEGLKSVAIIPVIHQDRVIACINIASHQLEEVPVTARTALETLAAQVGGAIARVQAEAALQQAKAELEVRVAERTGQLEKANVSLAAELRARKTIEKSLRYSEAKYRTLVEQIPAITYIIRWRGGVDFLYVSPQIETLLGFSPEAWRADARHWQQQIHPEDRDRVLAEIIRSFDSGEPFASEYRMMAKSGQVVWFRYEARVVHDLEGQFQFLQGLALDMTERKQAEEALQETSHTLKTLIQAAPLAIITLDLDYRISLWNPGAERLFGWQESEVVGGYLPNVPDGQWAEERSRLQREMAGAAQSALELKRVRQDGSIIYVHLWTASLRDANDNIIGNMGIVADITERKRAEEELRRQAELLDLAHDAILVRDLDNRILFWNSGATETYGWSRDEAQGQESHQLLQSEFSQPLAELRAELFHRGQWQGEYWNTTRDGRRIVVASRWALQRDKEGHPTAILEINRDITEQKQAEAGRARLAAILEATSDLVGTADLAGRILYLNRAGRNLLGIGLDEDVSRLTFHDLHPRWAAQLIVDQGSPEAIRREVWSGETAFLSRRGQEIPTSQVLVAHKDAAGRAEFFSTIARDISESKKAAEVLQEINNRLTTLVQASPLAIIAMNPEGKIISWNPAAERMFGWRQDEVMGQPLPTIPPDQLEEFQALYQRTVQGASISGLEQRRRRRDGSPLDISLAAAPLYDATGVIIGTMGIIEDITARKRMAETLQRVSRALRAITECHQALIRATNEAELLNEVCRIIVEVGGHRMVWVAFAQQDTHKSVLPVAQTGFDEGYVEQLNLTWAGKGRGRGPVGKAIRTGKPALCADIQTDPAVAFIREEARKRGYGSILALPLKKTQVFGALAIYAGEPHTFDNEEINLLMGLANDLAFGIMALRDRAERQRAEAALKESELELRLLTAQLLSIQEQERRLVSRELHDELGQALTVLKINLVAIEEQLSSNQENLKTSCEQMLSYIDAVIENVRRLSWDLSPSSLEDLGLTSSLAYLVDESCRNNHMECAIDMDAIDHLYSPETQINIYRIFQESLTNVIKHARADLVSVAAKRSGHKISFMIRDNGRGFDFKRAMSKKLPKRSLGLTAMNERVRIARGSLQIASRPGQGTTILFTIPIDNPGR